MRMFKQMLQLYRTNYKMKTSRKDLISCYSLSENPPWTWGPKFIVLNHQNIKDLSDKDLFLRTVIDVCSVMNIIGLNAL